MYVNGNNVTYFVDFWVEHILKEIKKLIGDKNVRTNIYRTQPYGSIMCDNLCIGFIYVMLEGKSLLNCTIFFLLVNMKTMIE